jgi:hypothetical protein
MLTVTGLSDDEEVKEVADHHLALAVAIDEANLYERKAMRMVRVDPLFLLMESMHRKTIPTKACTTLHLGAQGIITTLFVRTGSRVHHISNV